MNPYDTSNKPCLVCRERYNCTMADTSSNICRKIAHSFDSRINTNFIQMGKLSVGYMIDDDVDYNRFAIFENGKPLIVFKTEEAKEIAELMSSFFMLKAKELTDNELFREMRARGYSGDITWKGKL